MPGLASAPRVLAPDRRYIEQLDELEREDLPRLKKVKDGNARRPRRPRRRPGRAQRPPAAPELGGSLMAGYDAAADPDVVFERRAKGRSVGRRARRGRRAARGLGACQRRSQARRRVESHVSADDPSALLGRSGGFAGCARAAARARVPAARTCRPRRARGPAPRAPRRRRRDARAPRPLLTYFRPVLIGPR